MYLYFFPNLDRSGVFNLELAGDGCGGVSGFFPSTTWEVGSAVQAFGVLGSWCERLVQYRRAVRGEEIGVSGV